MRLRSLVFALALGGLCLGAVPPTPASYLGFEPGADRKLAGFKQVTGYFQALAAAAPDRVVLQELGPTSQGRKLFMAVLSSPTNLKQLNRIKAQARQLADPRGLKPAEVEALAKEGKSILMVTCSLHANEIGASQLSMEWAHALATTQDPGVQKRLEDVVVLLVPSINPDGLDMEVEWYRKHLGTPHEGGDLPWPYHVYAGHDNNRDWFMLTLPETRAVNRMAYQEWFPQVWLDMHQMWATGPRMFVPPYANPSSPRIPPLVHRTTDLLGTLMGMRLEEGGKTGVGYGFAFDVYWPGSSCETGHWKNTVGILTEVASARRATPVRVDGSELRSGEKGLSDYAVQVNHPNPWKGGMWRLRDILDYERIAVDALLEGCAAHRESLLRNRARMAQDAVSQVDPALHFRIPFVQRDPLAGLRLARLMRDNGVDVFTGPDAFWIPAAQPLGRFVQELMEVQRYPEVRPTPGAPILPPYDVTAWTLPLMLGATVERVQPEVTVRAAWRPMAEGDGPVGGLQSGAAALYALDAPSHEAHTLVNGQLVEGRSVRVAAQGFRQGDRDYPAGTFILVPGTDLETKAKALRLPLQPLAQAPISSVVVKMPRLGLYRAWSDGAEEGWTRMVLERHGLKPGVIEPKAVQKGSLRKAFDVIVLPGYEKNTLLEGRPKLEDMESWFVEELPIEYRGGIGKEGVAALKAFVEEGGTLVCLGESCNVPVESWELAVRNPLVKVKAPEFNAPGPLLNMNRVQEHPVTWGLPPSFASFPGAPMVFQGLGMPASAPRTVLTAYAEDARDVLASGWVKGADRLANRPSALAIDFGKGHLVLLGFEPVFRAQSEGTFRLLLNAITWAGMER